MEDNEVIVKIQRAIDADANLMGLNACLTNVLTVSSSGRVSAVGSGSATINAQITFSGKTYTGRCSVTVKGGDPPKISLGWIHVWLNVGDVDTIGLTGSTSEDGNITWSSSDSSVVRVDSTGTVTAISLGTVTITATISNQWGSSSDTCKITVEGSAQEETTSTLTISSFSASGSGGIVSVSFSVNSNYYVREGTISVKNGTSVGYAPTNSTCTSASGNFSFYFNEMQSGETYSITIVAYDSSGASVSRTTSFTAA